MRTLILLPLILLGACAHPGEDVELVANQFTPPASYSTFAGQSQPRVREWADFYFYQNATVEVEGDTDSWNPNKAIAGESIAIHLSEGSVIENTTAHPQYFELWIQIPKNLEIGHPYNLRSPAKQRVITRTDPDPNPDDVIYYSRLEDGEMAVSGMQGMAVPVLANARRTIATLTLISRDAKHLKFKLSGRMPIKSDIGSSKVIYHLNVDREYMAIIKTIKKL